MNHGWRDIATCKWEQMPKRHGKNGHKNHVVLAQGEVKHSPDLLPSTCTVLPRGSHLHKPNDMVVWLCFMHRRVGPLSQILSHTPNAHVR